LPGDRLPEKARKKNGSSSVFIAVVFFIIVGASVVLAKIPPVIFALYLGISLLTFILYAIDKSAAQKGQWRTQESTLHFFSLVGGWPGAMVAQQKLRHKSKKQPFRFIYWVTVFLNSSVFAWFFTTPGGSNAAVMD